MKLKTIKILLFIFFLNYCYINSELRSYKDSHARKLITNEINNRITNDAILASTTTITKTFTKVVGFTVDCDYICDGIADDIQIQQAINDTFSNFSEGNILLREGTYNIASCIKQKTDVNITGEGIFSKLVSNTTAPILILESSTTLKQTTVEKITFELNTAGSCITSYGNLTGRITVSDCLFLLKNNSSIGISGYFKYSRFLNNTIKTVPSQCTCFSFIKGMYRNMIIGNRFENALYGLTIDGTTPYSSYQNLITNNFFNICDNGLTLSGSDNYYNTVHGNRFFDNTVDIADSATGTNKRDNVGSSETWLEANVNLTAGDGIIVTPALIDEYSLSISSPIPELAVNQITWPDGTVQITASTAIDVDCRISTNAVEIIEQHTGANAGDVWAVYPSSPSGLSFQKMTGGNDGPVSTTQIWHTIPFSISGDAYVTTKLDYGTIGYSLNVTSAVVTVASDGVCPLGTGRTNFDIMYSTSDIFLTDGLPVFTSIFNSTWSLTLSAGTSFYATTDLKVTHFKPNTIFRLDCGETAVSRAGGSWLHVFLTGLQE